MKFIPIYASAGITGFESPASDYLQLPFSLDALLIEHPSATFIGRADGHSMQDIGIFNGDILIVDRQVQVKNNDVIVANFNGELICKILDTQRRRHSVLTATLKIKKMCQVRNSKRPVTGALAFKQFSFLTRPILISYIFEKPHFCETPNKANVLPLNLLK